MSCLSKTSSRKSRLPTAWTSTCVCGRLFKGSAHGGRCRMRSSRHVRRSRSCCPGIPAARCDPIPVLAFDGTKDANVHYEAGPGIIGHGTGVRVADLPGTIDNMADWAELDQCDTDPTVEKIGVDVLQRTYPGCVSDTDVELYTIVGGGHTWPGTNLNLPQLGVSTDTIDANDIIVRFFLDHPLRPS